MENARGDHLLHPQKLENRWKSAKILWFLNSREIKIPYAEILFFSAPLETLIRAMTQKTLIRVWDFGLGFRVEGYDQKKP